MADFTKRIIFIVLYLTSGITLISSSPYCEWNFCSPEETCCGDGICCPNTNISTDTYYIVAWVLSALLVLAVFCTGLFLKFKSELFLLFRRGSQSRVLLQQGV